ncbi:MAG: NAD(P)H-quinone oxidoreductase [Actinobacteria bacterium]|nr:NAD(P)H-quinone oxidoreductase [Actinomycetota bacterium]
MRAVVLTEFGGPEVLRIAEVPAPAPGPEEVLVSVRATALNRADLLERMGMYPNPFPSGHQIPGLEFSGVVESLGERVRDWKPGDAVMGIVSGGGYAEKLVIHERQAIRVPHGMKVNDAAAIPEVFITAWDALVAQGGLTSGRTALVHAGASGVGTAAIQICRAIGSRVIVTCSTPKMAACRHLGADLIIDYTQTDFVDAVRTFTKNRGVDVVLDVVGGDYVDRNINCLATKGSIIQVGTMAGSPQAVNVGGLMFRRARIIGTVLRARPIEEKIAISRRFADEVLPLFDSGALKPVIDSRYALADIARAHAHMAANANTGKILVEVS